MVDTDGTQRSEAVPASVETSSPVLEASPVVEGRWKLPEGIEDHIESGLINCAIGGIVGGLFGLVAFRSGGGWRGASAAAGVGVGLGSTLERASIMPKFK